MRTAYMRENSGNDHPQTLTRGSNHFWHRQASRVWKARQQLAATAPPELPASAGSHSPAATCPLANSIGPSASSHSPAVTCPLANSSGPPTSIHSPAMTCQQPSDEQDVQTVQTVLAQRIKATLLQLHAQQKAVLMRQQIAEANAELKRRLAQRTQEPQGISELERRLAQLSQRIPVEEWVQEASASSAPCGGQPCAALALSQNSQGIFNCACTKQGHA